MKKIHFIGIGGIGISGLARLYVHEGWQVSGSDAEDKPLLADLERDGVAVAREQAADNIADDIDLFVYSAAVPEENEELMAARAAGKSVKDYFEAVAEIANEYYLIAVAGTHGKTTTTAMLIDILEEASFDPTAIVGSLRTKTGSNYRAGKGKYFVVEACEWCDHFHNFEPDILVITNLEHEHVDHFKDLAAVQASFNTLAKKVPTDGAIIAVTKDPNIAPALEGVSATVYDYQEVLDVQLALPQPGLYNQMNAAAARKVAEVLEIKEKFIIESLENFAGTKRRFEYKGDVNNAPIYDDYAHHPTEIEAVISGAREKYPDKKLTIIFQPHTFSRTKELKADFVTALGKADSVVLVPIYAAREADDPEISSEMLVTELEEKDISAHHYFTLEAAAEAVKESVDKDGVILVLGAGTITKVASLLTV